MAKGVSKSRGQVFSGEFIIGFLLFMACLALLLSLWDSSTRDILVAENLRSLEDHAVDAAEQLVRTPGFPAEWTVGNVTSVGLANESRVLSGRKLKEFVRYIRDNESNLCGSGSNYECNMHMLGVGGYYVYFNISYFNGSTASVDGMNIFSGRRPVNDTQRITVVRTALLNDEMTRVYLTLWTNHSIG